MLTAARLVVGVVFGFFLPGYLIGRLLKSRAPFISAFIISSLLLFQVIFWLGVFSVPVSFATVLAPLVVVSGLLVWRCRDLLRQPRLGLDLSGGKWRWGLALAAGIVLLLLGFRLWRAPLMGPDAFFRWDFLARKLLALGHFDYYPPLTSADYRTYFYTDAIPPLVSFSYFWVYASLGRHAPAITSLLVVAQFCCLLGLAYRIGQHLFGGRAGVLAAAPLFSSPLFLWAATMGQETGYTAISVGAMVLFLLRAESPDDLAALVLAGFAAALGALSREYGWAFVMAGVMIACWRRLGGRAVGVFFGVAFVLAFPWYARTWLLTGNPFYSNPVATLFPVNQVHVAFLQFYASVNGSGGGLFATGRYFVLYLLQYAPLPLLLGLAGGLLLARRQGYLLATVAICVVVWKISIGPTYSLQLSTRVLTPAILLLAALGAGPVERLTRCRGLRLAMWTVLVLCCLRTVSYAAFYPVWDLVPPSEWAARFVSRESLTQVGKDLAEELSGKVAAGSRLLAADAYAHAALSEIGIDVVPVWSPEVPFIFDPALSGVEVRRRLRERRIGAVMYVAGAANEAFLERTAFYSTDRKHWRPLFDGDRPTVYLLPPP